MSLQVANLFLYTQNQTSLLRWVVKASDETISSDDTLSDDAELTLSLDASSSYMIEGYVVFTSDPAADFKLSVAAIGGGAAGSWGFSYDQTPTVKALGDTMNWPTDGSYQFVWWRGIIKTVTAGNYKVQWAQNTSNASNTTVLAGSWISALKVN